MTMLAGAREGAMGGLRRLVGVAMARDLCAFVVPGADVARAHGVDLRGAGLDRADSPRHASVLLIAGALPPALADAASVAYAQMPRPRAILALGAGEIAPLPPPDAAADLSQQGLVAGLTALRRAFATGAFSAGAADFRAPALTTRIEYTCPMHPEVVSDAPGKCPKCGMFLVQREAAAESHAGHAVAPAGVAPMPMEHALAHADHGGSPAPAGRYTCPMHPEVISDTPSTCPKCGMTLVERKAAQESGDPGHGASERRYTCPMHPEIISDTPGSCPKCGMTLVERVVAAEGDQAAQGGRAGDDEHAGHAGPVAHHSEHDGHDSGARVPGIEPNFMSMVELTRDRPASPDGLKMDWIEAPFGPFFPGLPGGLELTLTLDGDSVVRCETRSVVAQQPAPGFGAADLPTRIAALAPLAPLALRELACRALEAAAGAVVPPERAVARAACLERERIASHLSWLSGFAGQAGMVVLERRLAELQPALREADAAEITERAPRLCAFLHRLRATPLLRAKLAGIGRVVPGNSCGPVARAAGDAIDARAADPVYGALGFAVLTGSGGDALARLEQHCNEIIQSLDLIARAGAIALPEPAAVATTGHAMAEVETPRGAAQLHVTLEEGVVTDIQLQTPFARLAALIGPTIEQAELADALTAIGSLDLDPWGGAA